MHHVINDNRAGFLTRRLTGLVALVILSACSSDNGAPLVTTESCLSMGGTVVGDPGDGSIGSPEYRCPSGDPPIGTIPFLEEEPIAVEGAVCCLP